MFAYLAGSVQTDIKSALSFASLSQVGIIVAEIGLGFRYVALIHILGHACLRTLQFVRAPTLLHDYHTMENAIGEHLPRGLGPVGRLGAIASATGSTGWRSSEATSTPCCGITWRPRSSRLFRWFDAHRTPVDRLPGGRAVARVRGAQAPLRNDRGAVMRLLGVPWLELRDRHRADRLALGQPGPRAQPGGAAGPGVHGARPSRSRSWRGWASTSASDPGGHRRAGACSPTSSAGEVFALDELSAPLVPAVALLHFLTALATPRTKMRRFSFSWSLASEAIRLAMFSCKASWLLVGLLAFCTVPPYFELRNRRRPTRVSPVSLGHGVPRARSCSSRVTSSPVRDTRAGRRASVEEHQGQQAGHLAVVRQEVRAGGRGGSPRR